MYILYKSMEFVGPYMWIDAKQIVFDGRNRQNIWVSIETRQFINILVKYWKSQIFEFRPLAY